jgi:hypothetical protein
MRNFIPIEDHASVAKPDFLASGYFLTFIGVHNELEIYDVP